MAYYHDVITQKSWEELTRLKKHATFVLIGGWAVYLWARTLKSKDIDILVDYPQLAVLKKYYDVSKNQRLHKYEARREEIQIDVYLPHYSRLGIPVENLMKEAVSLEGFTVLKKEYLLALKLCSLKDRGRTVKGRKDFLDILSLFLAAQPDGKLLRTIIATYGLTPATTLFMALTGEYVDAPELRLNKHTYKRLKGQIADALFTVRRRGGG